jgi:hypothetical protein
LLTTIFLLLSVVSFVDIVIALLFSMFISMFIFYTSSYSVTFFISHLPTVKFLHFSLHSFIMFSMTMGNSSGLSTDPCFDPIFVSNSVDS